MQIVLRFVDPSLAPKGFTSLLLVMFFLGGIQLLCLAIIGSYLAHIYDEVERRPPYIVESTLNLPAVESTPEDEVPHRLAELVEAIQRRAEAEARSNG